MNTLRILACILSLSGCEKSGPYEVCTKIDDCDPKRADACVKPSRGKAGFCTLVCQSPTTCPATPSEQAPTCPSHYGVGLCEDPGAKP